LLDHIKYATGGIPRFIFDALKEPVEFTMVVDRLVETLKNEDSKFKLFAKWMINKLNLTGNLDSDEKTFRNRYVSLDDEDLRAIIPAKFDTCLDVWVQNGFIVTRGNPAQDEHFQNRVRFASQLFQTVSRIFVAGADTAGLTWIEHYGLSVPGGSTSQDPIEGLVAEGFAANGLDILGISMP